MIRRIFPAVWLLATIATPTWAFDVGQTETTAARDVYVTDGDTLIYVPAITAKLRCLASYYPTA